MNRSAQGEGARIQPSGAEPPEAYTANAAHRGGGLRLQPTRTAETTRTPYSHTAYPEIQTPVNPFHKNIQYIAVGITPDIPPMV